MGMNYVHQFREKMGKNEKENGRKYQLSEKSVKKYSVLPPQLFL